MRGANAVLVTNMTAKDRADLGIATAPDLDSAIHDVLAELAAKGITRPTWYAMPEALYTVPFNR